MVWRVAIRESSRDGKEIVKCLQEKVRVQVGNGDCDGQQIERSIKRRSEETKGIEK